MFKITINFYVQVMSAAIEVFSSKDANTQVNQCCFSFTLLRTFFRVVV